MKRNYALLLLALFAFPAVVCSQQNGIPEQPPDSPIQDNSFLVEEAYNQEPGVIQHINTFTRVWNSNAWVWTFTQEWPVPRHWRHQLSFTAAAAKPGDDLQSGFGDLLLNYRYQVVGNGESRVAFAPRASLIVPSGSSAKGTGYGGAGVQSNLPLSVVLAKPLVAHTNLGGTWIPASHDTAGNTGAAYGYTAGQSVIWLARPRFNVMFETSWSSAHAVAGPDAKNTFNTLWLAPGVRWAHNFKSGLQIVPGAAYIRGTGPSQGQNGMFLYLSFEHPLWRDSASAE